MTLPLLLIYINDLKHSCIARTELCTYFSGISVLQLKAKQQKFIFLQHPQDVFAENQAWEVLSCQ